MARLKIGEKSFTSMPITVKGIDKEKKTLTMIASSQDPDRHGDTILQDGWDLKPYKNNPVILNSHNYFDATEVIARAKKTWIEGKGKKSKLLQTWEFAVDENPKAKIIFDLYAGGFLHASSVGFIPRKFKKNKDGSTDYYTIEEAELLEVSAVSVPANAAATLAKGIGVEEDDLRKVVKVLDDETPEDEETDNEAIDSEEAETAEEDDGAGEKDDDDNDSVDPVEDEETETLDEDEPETPADPEPVRSAPKPTKKQVYARIIHNLNAKQERELSIARDTITRMLNGESKTVKKDYNSVIRRLLKVK